MTTSRIVAAIDGSSGADAALQWAAGEADRWDAELVAVLAWGYLDQHPAPGHEGFDPAYGQAQAEEAAAGYVARALGPDHRTVTVKAVNDLPARAILDTAAEADLLVMGARGLGGFRGLLVGSVSQRCLNETTVPLAVVHEGLTGAADGPVVVGVDGSDGSTAAYEWAGREAARRRTGLTAVYAWNEPAGGGEAYGMVIDDAALERAAHAQLDEATPPAGSESTSVAVERVAARGHAAAVLVDRSGDAAMVVVGHRGHRRWGRVAIGSVAQQVVHHSRCPVVVVPQPT